MDKRRSSESDVTDSDDEPLAKMVQRSASQHSDESRPGSSASQKRASTKGAAKKQTTVAAAKPVVPAQKTLTAFAHFFNDTQQSIRKKNGTATFEEVSRIVRSMWHNLDFNTKQMYHKKEEEDKERLEQSQSADEDDPEPSQETSASSISAASPVHESSHGDVYLQPTDSEEPMETTEVTDPDPISSPETKVVETMAIQPNIVNKTDEEKQKQAVPMTVTTVKHIKTLPRTISIVKSANVPESKSKIISFDQNKKMVVIKTTGGTDAIRVSGITIKERRGPASTSTTATTKPVTVYKTISVLKPPPGTTGSVSPRAEVSPQPAASAAPSPATSNVAKPILPRVHPIKVVKPKAKPMPSAQELKGVEKTARALSPTEKPCSNMCGKLSKKHKKWDDDFCSARCVVDYCRVQFKAWVAARN